MKLVRAAIESVVVERPEVRQEQPQGMCLDKGYDYTEVRVILAEAEEVVEIGRCLSRLSRSKVV